MFYGLLQKTYDLDSQLDMEKKLNLAAEEACNLVNLQIGTMLSGERDYFAGITQKGKIQRYNV